MKISKKVGFDLEINNLILNSSKIHQTSFSKEVNLLCKKGLENTNILLEIEKLNKEIVDVKRINLIALDLLKQIYSDLDLEVTDVRKSNNLKMFFKNRKADRYLD